MPDKESNTSDDGRDTIYLFGGLALIVLGAGLIAAHPTVRKTVSAGLAGLLPEMRGRVLPDLAAMGPDLQRYLKLRSM